PPRQRRDPHERRSQQPRDRCRLARSASHTELRKNLERYEVNGQRVYLLNRGSLVNLATGLGSGAPQLFDPFAAIMLLGLHAILRGHTADLSAGVQRYPAQLANRVARALVDSICD